MPYSDDPLMPTVAPCDVCVLLDRDERLKPDVVYCSKCDAWLCPICRASAWRRTLAFIYRRLGLGHVD